MKPNFLIIGAMKSGTTTLYQDLVQSTNVEIPDPKECWILTKADDAKTAQKYYREYYKNCSPGAILGDATTGYAFAPMYDNVPCKAKQFLGGSLKIIYITRDPLQRFYSHIRHDLLAGRIEATEVSKVVRANSKYVDVSRYDYQLSLWLRHFDSSNFLCIDFLTYVNNRNASIQKIVEFLEAEKINEIDELMAFNKSESRSNVNKFGKSIARSTLYQLIIKKYINGFFRDTAKSYLSSQVPLSEFTIDEDLLSEITAELNQSFTDFSLLQSESGIHTV